eukprot:Sspe_Gene.81880::Locus_53108_Transcript_1_1_Confidence_1.000_Length_1237::g.81880::m.81880
MPAVVDVNDPNAVLEFAIGPPPDGSTLVPQPKGTPLEFHGVYHNAMHTYIVKKAGLGSRDDWRCFDASTGRVMYNSHHPGKNPYEKLDPLGMQGGVEWEAICDVSGHNGGFKIRPKKLSMHGRQYIKTRNDQIVMSVAKISKLKSMSFVPKFAVCRGDTSDELVTLSSDMAKRTIMFHTPEGELIAVAHKPLKTLILNATLGVGTEMQVDIAPGVDCSFILAAFLGLQQCGEHVIKDAFGNFVLDPLQDEAVDQVTSTVPGADVALGQYHNAQNMGKKAHRIASTINHYMKA